MNGNNNQYSNRNQSFNGRRQQNTTQRGGRSESTALMILIMEL